MDDQLFLSFLDNEKSFLLVGPMQQQQFLLSLASFFFFFPTIFLLLAAACVRKDVDYRPRPQVGIIVLKIPPGTQISNRTLKDGRPAKPPATKGNLKGSSNDQPEVVGTKKQSASRKSGSSKTPQLSSSSNNNKAAAPECSSSAPSTMILEINQVLDGRQITASMPRSKSSVNYLQSNNKKAIWSKRPKVDQRRPQKISCQYNVSHSNGLPPPDLVSQAEPSSEASSQVERWKIVNVAVKAKQLAPLEKSHQQASTAVSPNVSKPEGSTDFQRPNYWIEKQPPPSPANSIGSKDKTPQEPFLVCSLPNSRLNFNGPFDETKTHRILLTNAGTTGMDCRQLQSMCWAIKPRSTDSDQLSAIPSRGILKAGQSTVVQVKCAPFKLIDANSNSGGLQPRDAARIDQLSIAWAVIPIHRQDCEQFNLEWIAHGNIGNRKNILITYTV